MTDTEDRDRIAQALESAEGPGVHKRINEYGDSEDIPSRGRGTVIAAILPLLAEARQQGAREALGQFRRWADRVYPAGLIDRRTVMYDLDERLARHLQESDGWLDRALGDRQEGER